MHSTVPLRTLSKEHTVDKGGSNLQGLPDAVSPESVLSLVDRLQTEALEAAESLGQKDSELASLKGDCTLAMRACNNMLLSSLGRVLAAVKYRWLSANAWLTADCNLLFIKGRC